MPLAALVVKRYGPQWHLSVDGYYPAIAAGLDECSVSDIAPGEALDGDDFDAGHVRPVETASRFTSNRTPGTTGSSWPSFHPEQNVA